MHNNLKIELMQCNSAGLSCLDGTAIFWGNGLLEEASIEMYQPRSTYRAMHQLKLNYLLVST